MGENRLTRHGLYAWKWILPSVSSIRTCMLAHICGFWSPARHLKIVVQWVERNRKALPFASTQRHACQLRYTGFSARVALCGQHTKKT